ncbi:MAG: glutathione S-transferase [Halieaceae bacterium]|nr:glutathione S-transferase [Halieaceae bacterium]
MSLPELYCIDYSPWSEKAKWALDFHNIKYRKIPYSPLMAAPALKFKVRKKVRLRNKLTVPILIDGNDIYADSFDVARYSERSGQSEQLFPAPHVERIKKLDGLSERLLNLLRAEVFARMEEIPEAKLEKLAKMPDNARRVSLMIFDVIVKYLVRKYPTDNGESIRLLLEDIRGEVNDRPYILDSFSYADITLAQPLQFISPVKDEYVKLGKFQRKTMEDNELADEFSDLLAWRDKLYEIHRRQK